ncbi:hypothetical protein [Pseudoalteromonas tunicata]|jgi:hypothetical protein|uniref:Uncharacterized protein n=1 Tax=Pseudoalteromonas tunicata D2 TaxID=87626 RepID=A4CEG7_9GAMM|nr:hypothetical protein [Pseudoalteromonas tunicata]ATC92984.1 hypothetical protein PTUN_a0151 [Pseudoalteromonas tunicata]AXT32080.1 hypothetical protein D1819_15460 [Pseudoalteromonas tunicata]EAR26979.1 hypothetical protein PTD2_10373 [Pseudoalteromonas tunicata D2]MDP4984522.1 hypothetical protein [Pseudoalteromonas tunicata]MDP5213695.1 hypothetical protein [Pseudoalteromonas tunicata]
MGIRLSLKKELMGNAQGQVTAEDIRQGLSLAMKVEPALSRINFELMSRFNDNHAKLQYQQTPCEPELIAQKHRLFNELMYSKEHMQSWVQNNGGDISL